MTFAGKTSYGHSHVLMAPLQLHVGDWLPIAPPMSFNVQAIVTCAGVCFSSTPLMR